MSLSALNMAILSAACPWRSHLMMRVVIAAAMLILPIQMFAQAPQMPMPETIAPASRPSIPLPVTSGAEPEQWERAFEQTNVRNVTSPALYPVLPRSGKANGKAVIVVPGGGYMFVSIESEGFRVADALAAEGYTAFVLKYRTLPTPRAVRPYMAELGKLFGNLGKEELADNPPAVSDLEAALALVHDQAAKWAVDPKAIGVIGFSAGARTTIRLLEGKVNAGLAANVALIYPPMTKPVLGGPRPPLFAAIAADDPLFMQGGLKLVQSWLAESPRTEFHLYSGGSHGFGMGNKGTTSDLWIDQYIAWLDRH